MLGVHGLERHDAGSNFQVPMSLCPPVIITPLDITEIIPKNLNITIITCCQPILQLFDIRWILTHKFTASEEITSRTVVLMILNAIKHKQGEHLVINEAIIIIMKQMLSSLLRTSFSPFDIVQISYTTRK